MWLNKVWELFKLLYDSIKYERYFDYYMTQLTQAHHKVICKWKFCYIEHWMDLPLKLETSLRLKFWRRVCVLIWMSLRLKLETSSRLLLRMRRKERWLTMHRIALRDNRQLDEPWKQIWCLPSNNCDEKRQFVTRNTQIYEKA